MLKLNKLCSPHFKIYLEATGNTREMSPFPRDIPGLGFNK